jgi:heat shock protein HtpX
MAATLGLSTYRWNNNLKSLFLLAAFPALLLLLLGTLCYVASYFLGSTPLNARNSFALLRMESVTGTHGSFDLACAVMLAYWPYVAGAAAVWVLVAYLFNDAMIHRATGARAVTRAAAPRLYNLLENLCISRGMTVPKLYVIETEAMNAYASGIDQRTYSITVTKGLVDGLSDEELEAVLGHELTHIIDRDVRLLVVTVVFVGMISYMAQMMWRGLRVTRGRAGLVLLVAAAIGGVGYLLALVLRFAISRRREYLADAGSVELTKNPEALISALRKISGHATVLHVPSEVRQMFIENPPKAFNLFATHPPLAKRIERLSEIAGIPADATPGSATAAPSETMAADLASLQETMETLQEQLKIGTHMGLQLRAGPKPIPVTSTAADEISKSRGLRGSDILVILLGIGIGAVIALVFF